MLTAISASKYKAKVFSSAVSCLFYSSIFPQFDLTFPFYMQGIRVISRYYHYKIDDKHFPARVSRGYHDVSSYSGGTWKSLSTQVSAKESIDEVVNEIFSSTEYSSISREEVCTHYIRKFCATGNIQTASRLVHLLRCRNIFLKPHVYNNLLEAASKSNDIELLSETFKDLLYSYGSLESYSYLILARTFLSQNDPAMLLNFITELSDMTLPRIDIVLNRVIFAFAKTGQVDNSLRIFNHMKSLRFKPDLVTYNTALDILGRLGQVDEMLHEFTFMKTIDLKPDVVTYNTVLNGLRKMGRLDLCLLHFKEMIDEGIEPELMTFKPLIESLGRSGNIKGALKIFDEMKHRGMCPSVHIYRALIFSLKKMGKMELALELSNEMNECCPQVIVPKDFRNGKR